MKQQIEFNEIIKEIFSKELSHYGLFLQNEENGMITFSSNKVSIKFIFDPRSHQNLFFLKYHANDFIYENFLVEQFLEIIETPRFERRSFKEYIISWAKFRFDYLIKFKESILLGDEIFFKELESYFKNQNEIYNKNLKKNN